MLCGVLVASILTALVQGVLAVHRMELIDIDPETCDLTQCQGRFELTMPAPPELSLHVSVEEYKCHKIPTTVKMAYGHRRRYSSYRYYGGILNPSEFYPELKTFTPSKQELISAMESKCLPVGAKNCHTHDPEAYEWWGGGAQKCLDQKYMLPGKNCLTSQQFECLNVDWQKFAFHTCLIDWEVSVSVSDIPVFMSKAGVPYSALPNGTRIRLDTTGGYAAMANGGAAYITSPHIEEFTARLHCYVRQNVSEKYCIPEGGGPVLSGKGRNVNNRWTVCEAEKEPKPIPLTVTYNTKLVGGENENDKPASIGDLKALEAVLRREMDRVDINNIKVHQGLVDTQADFVQLINHVAKRDPLLLSKLYHGASLFYSKFVSGKQFAMCPCTPAPSTESKACRKGGLTYLDGAWVKWNEKNDCYPPVDKPTALPLFDTYADDLVVPEVTKVVGASIAWEGWDRYHMDRDSIMNEIGKLRRVSGESLEEIITNPLQTVWVDWVSKFSSIVSWVALVIAVIALIRR